MTGLFRGLLGINGIGFVGRLRLGASRSPRGRSAWSRVRVWLGF